MFDSTTFTQDMLSDPSKLMSRTIDVLEATDTSNTMTITDPNNGFVMMTAAVVSLFSKFSEKVDYVASTYYRQRAVNAEQLYTHLSEFDYVKLMASPATLPFVFRMSKAWIVASAIDYDDNYRKIQIPATSTITMNGIVYSMYYPIDIFVNKNTGLLSAFYNTANVDALYSLESNILLDTVEFTQDSIDWFQITFNMFQFERSISQHPVSAEQGFVKSFGFDNQFYAVKVFSVGANNVLTELNYALDKKYYDYTKPTALITVMSDTSQVKIEIPQIYFEDGLLSNTVRVELYTTKGAVNYSLSMADVSSITANFDTTSSVYAAPLDKMPAWGIYPTTTEVAGGRDVMTYDQMRDAIVNGKLYSRAPITPPELTQAFADQGFTPIRYVDDVTDRMYFAVNTLTDDNGIVIPTFTGNLLIKDESLTGDPSTIIKYSDGFYTILPTTVFKTEAESTTVLPLTDSEINVLRNMNDADQVAAFNANGYVRQPFHITLRTTAKSPAARVYNLMIPEMTNLVFMREHPFSAPQMAILACKVVHQNDGTGGYKISMSVGRSENIVTADITNFRVIFTCKTKIGDMVYMPATYAGVDSSGNDVWEVIIATNYHLSTDDYLTVAMYNSDNVLNNVEIPLVQNFTALTAFISNYDASIKPDATLNNLLPAYFSTSLTVMAQQKLTITLGENLSSKIYTGVSTKWGNAVYATAPSDIFYSTDIPIYQKNESGVVEAKWNGSTNEMEMVPVYNIGDTPSSLDDLVTKTTNGVNPSANPAVIPVSSTAGVLIGMVAAGLNIPANSKVTAKTPTSITLSNPIITAIPSGTTVTFLNPHSLIRTTATQSAAGVQLTVASTADLLVGQSVIGIGIGANRTIASIDSATKFSLSGPTSRAVPSGTLLTIINKTAPGVVKIARGSILKDSNGVAQVITPPNNQFSIPMIFFDGRMFASQDPSDETMASTIGSRLQNYTNQITSIAPSLLEISDVYYKPTRTMGNATFGVGNNAVIRSSLQMSVEMVVYLDSATYNNDTAILTMRNTIYGLLNEAIQQPTIALSEIGKNIATSLGLSVTAVEMTKLNGSSDIRLIALEETDCKPSIENILVIQSDGTRIRQPNIKITFVPRPETVETLSYGNI